MKQLLEGFDIIPVEGGFQATWKGQPYGVIKASEDEAYEFAKRNGERYGVGGLDALMSVNIGRRSSEPKKAGLYHWTLRDGRTGALVAGGLSSAKLLLKEVLEVGRLPWGVKWERV